MAWTTPRTWSYGELVTQTMLNAHVRDNLLALKEPPSDQVIRNNLGMYTTTSTTLVAVDGANLKVTLSTNGGDVLVWFMGTFSATAGTTLLLDILIDGTARVGAGFEGLLAQGLGTGKTVVSIPPVVVSGLAAGEHNFVLLWRGTGGATLRLFSDTTSGTAPDNVPAILAAREVS